MLDYSAIDEHVKEELAERVAMVVLTVENLAPFIDQKWIIDEILKVREELIQLTNDLGGHPAVRRANVQTALPRISVMIVDDIQETRANIRKILLQNSDIHIICEAADGVGAINGFKVLLPDVVIMNIHMPMMNGIDVTEKMCSIKPDAKIIILTVDASPENRVLAFKAGACDFIAKPPLPDELLKSVVSHGTKQRNILH